MMVYLAGRWSRRAELAAIASRFERAGVAVTARWLTAENHRLNDASASQAFNASLAAEDLQDVLAADALILFTDGMAGARGGCHVEFGAALAAGLALAVVGPRTNVFTWMHAVQQFDSSEDALAWLLAEPGPCDGGCRG